MAKILIIDDDAYTCRLLERLLLRNGYDASILSIGKLALEHVKVNPVDLVLCDFRLPDMNGKDLLMQLKKIQPKIKVIIITGDLDVRLVKDTMDKGAFEFVAKPFNPETLLILIEKALKQDAEKS